MASFCLYDTLNAIAPCDTGGFWIYLSGPGAIQAYPNCGSPSCGGTPITLNPGTTAILPGASNGCLTCTGCTVTNYNPCVDLPGSTVPYTFRYSTKCIGDCCSPDNTLCTADLVIHDSSIGVTISDMVGTCTYTAAITFPPTDLQSNSTLMTSHLKLHVSSPCDGGVFSELILDDAVSGQTANGFDIPLNQNSCEQCALEKIKFSIRKTNGTIVHSPYIQINANNDMFNHCPGEICGGTSTSNVAKGYQCYLRYLFKKWADAQGDGTWTQGTDFDLQVHYTGTTLQIRMVNKNVGGSSKWGGFDKNTDTVSYQGLTLSDCIVYTLTASAQCFDHCYAPNSPYNGTQSSTYCQANFSQNVSFFGQCFTDPTGPLVSGSWSNIADLSACNFNTLVANSTASWINVVPLTIAGWSGSGTSFTISCITHALTAIATGCTGTLAYEWRKNGGPISGTMSTYNTSHTSGASTDCVSVRVTCNGGCAKCSHICLTNTMPYYSGPFTGNCSSGCSNNSTCT